MSQPDDLEVTRPYVVLVHDYGYLQANGRLGEAETARTFNDRSGAIAAAMLYLRRKGKGREAEVVFKPVAAMQRTHRSKP